MMRPLTPRIRRVVHLYLHRLALFLGIGGDGPRVLSNSVPKAGSNLLLRCLELMPGIVYARVHLDHRQPVKDVVRALRQLPAGEFATAHLPFSLPLAQAVRDLGIRPLLMIRDPRDVVVSHVYWVTYRYTEGRFHPYFRQLPDDQARLMASILGTPPLPDGSRLEDIGARFRSYLKWAEHGALIVRFERLVGPEGGGSREAQVAEIMAIARHIGLALSVETAQRVARRLFSQKSPTFRSGRTGSWRDHFTPEHKIAFKEVAGDLLIELGYENDLDW